MKPYIIIILFPILFVVSNLSAQHQYGKPPAQEKIYKYADAEPLFPGGEAALNNYLKTNAKLPDGAPGGRVILSFVVTDKGKITDIKVERSIDPRTDQVAVSLVEKMPDWKPGLVDKVPVNVMVMLPIMF